ncbi:MAG: hypothetical protein QOD13_3286 [Thermoleophilaceae bacterium]|jgi:hypothetical protein|nr:hypothetical protein [Thermoleophilaceae bacterium]
MWGELVDVSGLNADLLVARRQQLRLSKAETARRMYEYIARTGPGARDGIALSGSGLAWSTEPACRRALDDLEFQRRRYKEAQYVDAVLAVLDLTREETSVVEM